MAHDVRARVVFVSYAHENDDLRRRLEVVLKPLVRKNRLEIWADDRIGISRAWSGEIEANVVRAELAVLLVSADFLASDYVMDVELPRLVERGVPLVCVPTGSCGWHDVEDLARVQWPLPPERPLSAMSDEERDGALMVVYEALAKLAAQMNEGSDELVPPAASRVAEELVVGVPGRHVGVPALPERFQPRPGDLESLKQLLATTADVALVGPTAAVGLHGGGGVGKSVLAAALCRQDDVRSWFPDGVFWLTLGETPDLVGAQRELVSHLGGDPSFSDPLAGRRALRALLEGRRCLVVVDDVWSAGAAEALAGATGASRVLYTTRDASVLAAVGATTQPVDVLAPDASLAFLEQTVGPIAAADRALVDRAIAQTGGVILALSLVAGVVRAGGSWVKVAARLEALAQVFRAHPYADVFKTMRLAVDHLGPVDAERYLVLGVFPEDVSVPQATLGRLWGVADPGPTLARLADSGLVASDDGRVRFHDLQRAFLVLSATEPWPLLHRHLLDRHRPQKGWAYLTDDEPYLWDQLLYHLQMAGEHHEMAAVVTNGRWLARRLHRDGVYPAETDVARAAALQPQDHQVAQVLRVLRRWAALFPRDLNQADIAAALISRLPDAEPAATDLLGPMWMQPVWDLPDVTTALVRTLAGHTGGVYAVAFAPDGRTLAAAAGDGTVRLWDPATGAELRTLAGHTGGVYAVAFAPDGRTLASAAGDGTVRLWDPATGAELRTLAGHTGGVRAVAFAPDGRTLASAAGDGTVRLWDPATGAELRTLAGHTGGVYAVAFAPDGRTLASAAGDGTVRLWDPATGAELRTLAGHTDWVRAVAFAPDGRTLAAAGRDGAVRLWDPATGAELRTLAGHTGWVYAVAFAPDGRTLASAGRDGTVRLWDPATGAELRTLAGHTGWVYAVAFAPDGRTLASAGRDGTLRLWDPATGAELRTLAGHTGGVYAVAFAPDGRTLASAADDGTVRLWDPATGAELRTLAGHTGGVYAVAFAPDGRTLASAAGDGTLRLWDPATGAELRTLAGHTGGVRAVAFAPDGRTLASAAGDGTVRLWDPATGAELRTLAGHTGGVYAVAFAPDGRTLASAAGDGTLRLWDPATGAELRTLAGHTDWVRAVAFAPDGRTLASAGRDGTVRLWDPATGAELRTLAGHTGGVYAVAFAPDGRTLASAADDGTVRLWDPATETQLASISLGGAGVTSCSWSPTGGTVAAGWDRNVIALHLRTKP